MQTNCKAYDEMLQNLTVLEKPQGLLAELTQLTGDEVNKPSDVSSIFITLWAEVSFCEREFYQNLKFSFFTSNYMA